MLIQLGNGCHVGSSGSDWLMVHYVCLLMMLMMHCSDAAAARSRAFGRLFQRGDGLRTRERGPGCVLAAQRARYGDEGSVLRHGAVLLKSCAPRLQEHECSLGQDGRLKGRHEMLRANVGSGLEPDMVMYNALFRCTISEATCRAP